MIEILKLKILSDVGRLGDLVIMKTNKHALFWIFFVYFGKMAITFASEVKNV
jgi:hypothetical protein